MDLRRIFLFELPIPPEAYLKQKKKELSTKGHEGVEVNRDGIPRSRRDCRFLIVSLSYDPQGGGDTCLKQTWVRGQNQFKRLKKQGLERN